MSNRNFRDLLEARWASGNFVCVGLDSDLSKIPECVTGTVDERIVNFNLAVFEATQEVAGAYKINSAFYEGAGSAGLHALRCTIGTIKARAPHIPVILDAKRADIGDTNVAYAKFAFEVCNADAVTVHPYLGREALKPFLEQKDKGIIVLCRTSNKGAGEFQDLPIGANGEPLYIVVARHVMQDWNEHNNCALVAGATYPEELGRIRRAAGELPLLIPGIGKQGGDLLKAVVNGKNSTNTGIIINSSSGIIFASKGEDYAEKAGAEARRLNAAIVSALTTQVKEETKA